MVVAEVGDEKTIKKLFKIINDRFGARHFGNETCGAGEFGREFFDFLEFGTAMIIKFGKNDVTFLDGVNNAGGLFAGGFGGVNKFVVVDFKTAGAKANKVVKEKLGGMKFAEGSNNASPIFLDGDGF